MDAGKETPTPLNSVSSTPWASANTSRKSVAASAAPGRSRARRRQTCSARCSTAASPIWRSAPSAWPCASRARRARGMCGILDATGPRLAGLPAGGGPLIVIPSYNGARKLPVLTPLLALLLAREGLPVLLHGMRTEARRVLASDVLLALDVPALTAPEKIANGALRHLHTRHLHGGLARLLSVREVVGLRNPGHSAVKLMNPCAGPAVVVTSYTHPEYFEMLQTTFRLLGMTALLSRGL